MEIKDMTLTDVEARIKELDSLVENAENAENVDAFTEELRALNERKAELVALEQRRAAAAELQANKPVEPIVIKETRKENENMKTIEEFRNSKEYIDAYAEYIKSGNDEELRALLTTNVGSGDIAVPDFVYDIIKTDWEKTGIMALVKRISVQGNMKVQFELSAGDAVIHTEGSGAVAEEELTLGIVTLVPESIKKWVSVSDEALDMRGEAFLMYIYDELTHKIAVKAEKVLIDKIKNLSTSADATHVCVQKLKAGATVSTIALALGKLSAEAQNPVVVMHPSTKAAFVAAGINANYAVDVFQGLPVYTTNALPAIGDATENAVYAIVGDFGMGALANFPNGEEISIKVDDKTLMEYDLVKILGREYVAVEPIACNAFVNLTAPASA